MEENQENTNDIKDIVNKFEGMISRNENIFFDVEEFEDIAGYYLDEGKPKNASKVLEFATEQHPYNGSLFILFAQILASMHRSQVALNQLAKAETLEPYNPEIFHTRASIYSQIRMPSRAIDSLKQAIKFADKEEKDDILINMAFEYENLDNYEAALECLKEAVALNKDNETALFEIAFCYDFTDKTEESIEFFQNFLDTHPYSYIAWYNLGMSLSRLKLYEKALEAYDYAIAIKEEFSSAYFSKANTLLQLDRFEDAIKLYKATFKYEEPDASTFYNLGECYENLKDFTKALEYYNKAVKYDPYFADAWMGIGVIYDEMNRLHEGIHYIKKALDLDPDNCDYVHIYADVQTKMGFYEEAELAYIKVINEEADNEQAWVDYALLQFQQEEKFNAIATLKEGLEKNPDCAILYYQIGAYLLTVGSELEALTYLERALTINYEDHYKIFEFLKEADNFASVLELISNFNKDE